MFVQSQDLINNKVDSCLTLSIPLTKSLSDLCAAEHTLCPYKTDQCGTPNIRPDIYIDVPCNTEIHRKRNIICVLTCFNEDLKQIPATEQFVGAFAGFQATVQPSEVKSKPYDFLTIFSNPPNKSVVHEVMGKMIEAATSKNMPFIQLVGDQVVYTMIVQITYEHPDDFYIILPCMSPFHIHCCFISTINKRLHGLYSTRFDHRYM